MRAWIVALALVIAGTANVPVAAAQPRTGPPPRTDPAPLPRVDRLNDRQLDRRDAVKKKIRAMRAYTLTEELELDEKSAAKLFPVLAKWDEVSDKLIVQRLDVQRRLAAATAVPGDPKVLDKLIDEAIANQKAFWDLEDKRLSELRKILTPTQTARLIVVLPAFERRIQKQLQTVTRRRTPRRDRMQDPFAGEDEERDADRDLLRPDATAPRRR
ncbi:MAG: hypothetical protein H0T89_23250 [Deltaproteobacteria bacterium]|nr:hypothetical protein [Deltaproteobacteria bacterium]